MFQKGSFVRWLLGTLIVIVMLAGVGFGAYRYGYARGMADAPEIASAFSKAAENGQFLPLPHMSVNGRAFGGPFMGMRSHFGFFPFGGLLGFFLLAFLFFGLMRLICRPHWYPGAPGMHGHWHGYPPPWAQECKEEQTGRKEDTTESK